MAEESDKKEIETVPGKPAEDWMARKWRPMMGWTYMATCVFDFVIAPIAWSMLQALLKQPVTQWMPVTLQGAGLYHIAMGAVLGIAAYGRTQEKLGGANNGGITAPSSGGTTYTPPAAIPQSTAPTTFGAPAASGFGSAPSAGFGSNAGFGAPAAEVTTGFGGKPAPVIPPFPEK